MHRRSLALAAIVLAASSSVAVADETSEVFLYLRGKANTGLEFCLAVVSGSPPVELSSLRVGLWHRGGRRGSGVEALWLLLPANGRSSAPVLGCIKYGVIPPGFGGTTPTPLTPYNYYVDAYTSNGRKSVTFTVNQEGAVTVWNPEP